MQCQFVILELLVDHMLRDKLHCGLSSFYSFLHLIHLFYGITGERKEPCSVRHLEPEALLPPETVLPLTSLMPCSLAFAIPFLSVSTLQSSLSSRILRHLNPNIFAIELITFLPSN